MKFSEFTAELRPRATTLRGKVIHAVQRRPKSAADIQSWRDFYFFLKRCCDLDLADNDVMIAARLLWGEYRVASEKDLVA